MPDLEISETKSVDIISEADLLNAGKTTKRRAPSLFERMTGTGRARHEADLTTQQITPSNETSRKKEKEKLESEIKTSEPKLGITKKPEKTITITEQASEEDDPLEIPAFLRRQAN